MARAKSKFKEDQTDTKLRGGYYTSTPVASYLCRWILGARPTAILEPSCGDGQFLRALARVARNYVNITAVELNPDECRKATSSVVGSPFLAVEAACQDFLCWSLRAMASGRQFDAVLGNPPYVRYQYLEEPFQAASGRIFDRFGLNYTKHTNAWVPFVIASMAMLAPGGRLAMVIPSEILHVLHATSLRRFLVDTASKILVLDPVELLFGDALQGTVLLMVEKKRSQQDASHGVCIQTLPDNSFLDGDPEARFAAARFVGGEFANGKWTSALLTDAELNALARAADLPAVHRFSEIATVDVGMVTGANDFFLVSDEVVARHGLDPYAKPMFGRSDHCPGVVFDEAVHQANLERGLPGNFIDLNGVAFDRLPQSVRDYIALGEERGLHRRFKCRTRMPWYAVPSVYATEIGMLKRSHHFPKLIRNTAGALTTDTAYRVRSLGPSPDILVHAFVNSLTALSAELEGRSYGGGVLELTPSEIERLLVPVPTRGKPDLAALDAAVRGTPSPDALLQKQDRTVLIAAGVNARDIATIQVACQRIRGRRQRQVADAEMAEAA